MRSTRYLVRDPSPQSITRACARLSNRDMVVQSMADNRDDLRGHCGEQTLNPEPWVQLENVGRSVVLNSVFSILRLFSEIYFLQRNTWTNGQWVSHTVPYVWDSYPGRSFAWITSRPSHLIPAPLHIVRVTKLLQS
jgi:hypothetical protein